MEIVIKFAQFLLSLSLLIILHELGHFIPAKLFKTRVEKFYLFTQKENRRNRIRNWLVTSWWLCKNLWDD